MLRRVFTGIVEELGTVERIDRRDGALGLKIGASTALEGTGVGDSIAVNGVCLTVVSFDETSFSCEAVPETLARTNLGELVEGAPVNLERAVSSGRTFGGHYVQGHIDGTAEVIAIEPEGEAKNYRFRVPVDLARYVVPKGFIALDGASLTVVDAVDDELSVTLIPHTQTAVVMGAKPVGYRVNVEVDVLGKYVERIARAHLSELEARIEALEEK